MADRIQMESGVTGSEAPVEEVAQDRPEWLPEKFASAEDMAKAQDAQRRLEDLAK